MIKENKLVTFKIQGLYSTPENINGVSEWINLYPPADRAQMFTAAGMQWNWMAKTVNKSVTRYEFAASEAVNKILQREGVEQAVIMELLEALDLVSVKEIACADNQS